MHVRPISPPECVDICVRWLSDGLSERRQQSESAEVSTSLVATTSQSLVHVIQLGQSVEGLVKGFAPSAF